MEHGFGRVVFGLCWGLSALALAGCSRSSLRAVARPQPGPPESALAEFAYARVAQPSAEVTLRREEADCAFERLELEAAPEGTNFARKIAFEVYRPPGASNGPVVLVMPMLSGGHGFERGFARHFAARGYTAVLVRRRPRSGEPRLEELNAMLREGVVDSRQVLDWLQTRPDFDTGRLALFGFSIGAIRGALLLGVEPRIQAAVLALPGGDLPYILLHSTEPTLVRLRQQTLAAHGLAPAEAEPKLRQMLTCDPLRVAAGVDPRKVLLLLARFDTVVPVEKGLELKARMGHPETVLIPTGHRTAALLLPYIRQQACAFFERRFQAAAAGGPHSAPAAGAQ